MTAEIIAFTTRPRTRCANDERRETVTAKNQDLRHARYKAWRKSDIRTRYWDALLTYTDAARMAAKYGVEGAPSTPISDDERWSILERYRESLGAQLLTPAPDMASVSWKRRKLKKDYIGVERTLAEKAIADDVAFLDAHPTRRSGGAS